MKLTRQQLYDKVWKKGTSALQKELDLSYVELKKMCEDLNIPRPSSAYWSALSFGKKVEQIALPASVEDMPEEVETDDYKKKKVRKIPKIATENTIEPAESAKDEESVTVKGQEHIEQNSSHKDEIVQQEAEVRTDDEIFKVPEILYAKDPIIFDTIAKHREKVFESEHSWDTKNPFKCKAENYLDVNVSKESFDRAIRIFYTIIRAARHFGYEIDTKHKKGEYGRYEGGTFFVVKGQRIQVDLTEKNRRVKNEESNYDSYDYVPSGDLKFRILATYSFWNKEIKDTKCTRLEDKIEAIIHDLEDEADRRIEEERQQKIREEQKRIEEERKRREEEERKRQEALRKDEREKVMSLLVDVERHAVAERMYDYIRDFKNALADKGVEMTDELRGDIEWMQKKADWMNPFLEVEDEILTSEDYTKILHPNEKKTSNPYRSWNEPQEPEYNYWQTKNAWWRKK